MIANLVGNAISCVLILFLFYASISFVVYVFERITKRETPISLSGFWALSLGLLSWVAWIVPIFGLIISILGLIFGINGIKKSKLAIVGTVLSLLGLLATIINSALGAYMGYTGQWK